MTDKERITALEARIAQLEARLARIESWTPRIGPIPHDRVARLQMGRSGRTK